MHPLENVIWTALTTEQAGFAEVNQLARRFPAEIGPLAALREPSKEGFGFLADLLGLIDSGIQITPPDLNGTVPRIFVPREALAEMTVLGVVGIARRKPAAAAPSPSQPKLFSE